MAHLSYRTFHNGACQRTTEKTNEAVNDKADAKMILPHGERVFSIQPSTTN